MLILPSPFPWLWFCWIVNRDILSWLFDARGKIPKEPFPVHPPADTRRSALATLAAQAARQRSTGLELGPPIPALRANPFPEVTDPFFRLPLPTLFHRPEAVHLGDLPDAVMSTTRRERHSVLRIFKGRRECTGHHVTCGALPAAGPYLRNSRRRLRTS
ncbi:unnamed protein product [Brassica rapa subsp. trilocularis]